MLRKDFLENVYCISFAVSTNANLLGLQNIDAKAR